MPLFDRLKDEEGMTSIPRHFKAQNKEGSLGTKSRARQHLKLTRESALKKKEVLITSKPNFTGNYAKIKPSTSLSYLLDL